MTIKELDKEAENYAFHVAEGWIANIEESTISDGYIQGYARALQRVIDAVANNSSEHDCYINLASLVGDDNLELLTQLKEQGNV